MIEYAIQFGWCVADDIRISASTKEDLVLKFYDALHTTVLNILHGIAKNELVPTSPEYLWHLAVGKTIRWFGIKGSVNCDSESFYKLMKDPKSYIFSEDEVLDVLHKYHKDKDLNFHRELIMKLPAREWIKMELSEYAKTLNVNTEVYVTSLAKLAKLNPATNRELPDAVLAWELLQEHNHSTYAYCNDPTLGEFIYDKRMYILKQTDDGSHRLVPNPECEQLMYVPVGCKTVDE